MCRGAGSVYVGALPSTSLFAESIYHYAVWYFQTIYTESCFHVSGIEWQCVLTNFATWNDLEWPAQRVIWSWERYNNSANVSERAVTKTTRPSFSPQWQRQSLAVKACGLLTILRPGKRGRILILTYLTGVEIRIHPVLSRVGDEASKHLPTLGRKDAFPWNLMKFALKTSKTCDSRCCDGMVRRTGRLKQRQERSEKPLYFVALPQPFFLVKSATRKRFSLLCDSCNGLGWLRQRWLWMGLPSNDDDAMGQRQGKGRPLLVWSSCCTCRTKECPSISQRKLNGNVITSKNRRM